MAEFIEPELQDLNVRICDRMFSEGLLFLQAQNETS